MPDMRSRLRSVDAARLQRVDEQREYLAGTRRAGAVMGALRAFEPIRSSR
jgi:hypothetical protein